MERLIHRLQLHHFVQQALITLHKKPLEGLSLAKLEGAVCKCAQVLDGHPAEFLQQLQLQEGRQSLAYRILEVYAPPPLSAKAGAC